MRSNTFTRTALVVIFVVALTAIGSPTMGQQVTPAKAQAPRVIKWDGDIAWILYHVSQIYDGAIGLEVDPQQPQTNVAFYLKEPTLPDILNAIVQSGPKYQWRERDGSFEVFPVAGSNPLLDTMVQSYRVTDVDQEEALNRLLILPEFQAAKRAIKPNHGDPNKAAPEKTPEKFSLSLENVTLRQALNRIVQAGGGRFWILRRQGDGSFLVESSPG